MQAMWRLTLLVACVGVLHSEVAGARETTDEVYLFTTFRGNGETGLRFAYSFDGYRWINVPGTFLKPRVGRSQLMRDPSLKRGPDGTFHLVWTTEWKGDQGFGHASSTDLVHWSEQQFVPVMEHEPTTVNVWAPELYYDGVQDRYIICWASTIPDRYPDHLEERTNNHRMYYTTTSDFKSFSPTRLFIEPGFSVIDCTIVKRESDYVLVLKDNTRPERNLRVAFGSSPLGPWENVSAPFTKKLTEGPTTLKLHDDWIIYFDSYGDGTYGAVKTHDFIDFENISGEIRFPEGHKHGTLAKISRKELLYLIRVGSEQIADVRLPVDYHQAAAEVGTKLAAIEKVANQGPFQPNWESLSSFEAPQWYRDGKFGIFIHWGGYSVPAFANEWYPRNMYRKGSAEYEHHLQNHGPHANVGYKDLIAQFKAEKFDPEQWAKLFRDAGARYVVPVAEHHDGFPMYDSEYTEWSAAKKGPRRDVLGELSKAIRHQGIVCGASSHRAAHWWFFAPGLLTDSDVLDANNAGLYGPAVNKRVAESQSQPPDKQFLQDWLLRSCEIVDKYRPEVMYFDWWICQPVFQPYLKQFAAYYYNRGVEWDKQVAINFKKWEGSSFPDGVGVLDIERGKAPSIQADLWQTCTSVSKNSWGYVTNHQYKEIDDIVDDLVDIVSKNGTMLLNIGPKSDGTIPEVEQQMLRKIGQWLKTNDEAIYGSRPWTTFGEGPAKQSTGSFGDTKRQSYSSADIRFTVNNDALYAIALDWPEDGKLLINSISENASAIESVSLLGHQGSLSWQPTSDGLEINLPDSKQGEFAHVLKITGVLSDDAKSSANK